MKVCRQAILTLPEQGHATVEVRPPSNGEEVTDLPDEWFMWLMGNLPGPPGKGRLYLTRAGFLANQDAIRAAYEHALERGLNRTPGGWGGFLQEVDAFFASIERTRLRKLSRLRHELLTLRELFPDPDKIVTRKMGRMERQIEKIDAWHP